MLLSLIWEGMLAFTYQLHDQFTVRLIQTTQTSVQLYVPRIDAFFRMVIIASKKGSFLSSPTERN